MKKLLLLVAIMSFGTSAYASHAYGGEITWKCFTAGPNAGKFQFYMTLYRDCGSGNATLPGGTVSLSSNSPAGTINLTQVGVNMDVSPTCYLNPPPIRCNVAASGQGALEEARYESAFINLTGTPPASGWQFSYSLCCRPGTLTNLVNPNSQNLFLRAVMYPFNVQGVQQNTNNCYDSSPRFLEPPKSVTCTGSPFNYVHLASDDDLDSIYYDWAPSLTSAGVSIGYVSPYTSSSPLPNGGSPAQLNNVTGNITFTPSLGGSFATSVKVSVYRVGQLIAEIFRDIPIAIRNNCSNLPSGLPNTPPTLAIVNIPGFQGVTPVVINGDTVFYEATVFAGQQVRFNLVSQDPQINPNQQGQTISFSPKGGQFGSPLSSSTAGCINPPCATLTPISPQTSLSSPLNNSAQFNWQTSCSHTNTQGLVGSLLSYYPFQMVITDDNCPIPAFSMKAVFIKVVSTTPVPPDMTNACATVNANGTVGINWGYPADTGMNFDAYIVYHSTSPTTPFTAIDTVKNYSSLSYTDLTPGPGANYYYIRTKGGCESLSIPSDTLKSSGIMIQPQNFIAYSGTGWANFKCKSSDNMATYQWQLSNGAGWIDLLNLGHYLGATSDSLVITGISSTMNNYGYRCIVTSCTTDTSDVAVLTVVNGIGLGESSLQKLTVSPNPTNGMVSLNTSVVGNYELLTLDGRVLESGTAKKDYDLTIYPAGVYTLNLTTDEGIKVLKVVKN